MARLERFENDIFTLQTREAVGVRQLLSFDGDADNRSATSEGNKLLMAELFVSYRVLDLLVQEKGITGLLKVPSHRKIGDLGVPPKTVSLNNLTRCYR